ncbi:hypothetical protein MN869_13305 [Acinetobacter sp. NIPH1876]|uniref:hypothetical protein n=1 Tax=unclassified Acinetobacter TaxID=196816 RepID=UPI001FAD17A4|nr:hypothetical protein [Acinetobacter sp. NIPH1876]MCJ0829419.1 hypothetical protein [Acinetobacter sp. NIPH1876]
MNFLKKVMIFSIGLVVSSFGFSKENGQNIKVEPCGFDYDVNNYYCKADKIKVFEKNIGMKPDFNKDYSVIKIEDGKYYRLAVLNQKSYKVYPLNYQINKAKANFNYSAEKDELCISGDLYSYRDTYLNSKACFKIIDNAFVKVSIIEDISQKNNGNNLVFMKTPISSDFFSKCTEKNPVKKCEQLERSNNRAYSLSELKKISPDFLNIFDNSKIDSLNTNTFRFLPKTKDSFYSIAEKYIETDEDSSSEFYLITLKPKLEIEKIGDYYSIDSLGVITYKNKNGKLLKRDLK